MMFAVGKGVQQDSREGSLRSGMGNLRTDPELSARWSKFNMSHPEYSPVMLGDKRL